ncbi:MAG TPA: DUF4142 domain-containing protein [Vulgatibacter sp.]
MSTANQKHFLVVLASFALLVGCATTSQPEGSDAKKSSRLSDAQIAAIVTTANGIDVDNGALAMERSTNDQVKQFATRMMEDHTSVNQAAVALVTRLGVAPEETDTSRGLAASALKTRRTMSSLTGSEFDKAYVDNEVAYHAAVIEVLDTVLIPSAQNAELKSMLVSVRPAFVAHLEHARSIQASLGGAAPGGHSH